MPSASGSSSSAKSKKSSSSSSASKKGSSSSSAAAAAAAGTSSSKKGSKKRKLTPAEARIYEYINKNAIATQVQIDSTFPDIDLEERIQAINGLARLSLIRLQTVGGELQYEAASRQEANVMAELEGNDLLVYTHIRDAGNEGIWTKTIKLRANLHQTVVNRCLKSLEQKHLIKTVKNVKFPTRKIVMLYNLEPSSELSGGPWYSDTELDEAFIEAISNVCLRFIQQRTWPEAGRKRLLYPASHAFNLPTAQQILDHAHSTKAFGVTLSLENMNQLLDTLIYDEKIEKVPILPGQRPNLSASRRQRSSGSSSSKKKKDKKKRKRSSRDDSDSESGSGSGSEDDDEEDGGRNGGDDSDSANTMTDDDDDGKKRSNGSSSRRGRDRKDKRKHRSSSRSSSRSRSSSGSKRKRSRRSHDSDSSEDDGSDSGASEDEGSVSSSSSSASDSRRKKRKRRRHNDSSSSRSGKRSSSSSSSRKKRKRRHISSSSDDDGSSGVSSEDESESDSGSDGSRGTPASDDEDADPSYGASATDAFPFVFRALRPMHVYSPFQTDLGQGATSGEFGTGTADSSWMQTPCGVCPVFRFCQPGGPVNAEECEYYDQWIEAGLQGNKVEKMDEDEEGGQAGEGEGDDADGGAMGVKDELGEVMVH
ncbi:34-kDa subunit of RNA polymerase III (C) [Tilletia horrida]|nr:34-kDa subunit of RNA polymerase III (C) [Tilletia horrida]